jgi:hypothetical protein
VQHIANAGGIELAHADEERFVEAVCDVVTSAAAGESVDPMLERNYYDRLTNHGIADPEDIWDGECEHARTIIENALRDGHGRPRQVRREWFETEIAEIPAEVRETVLDELRGVDSFHPSASVRMTTAAVELEPVE